jgi:hypothetical protein
VIRYWFEFDRTTSDTALISPWWGVTAHDLEDAKRLLIEHAFKGDLPPIARLVENVDVSTLDPDHVLINMNPPIWYGIWYPIGWDWAT